MPESLLSFSWMVAHQFGHTTLSDRTTTGNFSTTKLMKITRKTLKIIELVFKTHKV